MGDLTQISRKEAKLLGLKRYFTGRLCRYGHACERLISNKGCIQCNKNKLRAWRIGNPERVAAHKRRAKGLPEPTRACPEFCEICGSPSGQRSLDLDHSHEAGEFRGWLCNKCNLGLGLLGDNAEALGKVTRYLER
ncbi:hypothetical protein LCGC14_0582100 [marine sediment metagenome]|uniref:Recombination endonuclease VII n=1 Tax=marine sediment metagenome TaxID=412755 RepID=A0A0F9RG24_9ZZZZ